MSKNNNGTSLKNSEKKKQSTTSIEMLNSPTEDGQTTMISKDPLFMGVQYTKETRAYLSFKHIPGL